MNESDRGFVVAEIARHQARLRGFARCLLVRPSDVDDLVQEVNVVLWERAAEFRPGTDFWAWASQIARFKAFNLVRKYGRERLVFDEATLARLADVAEVRAREFDQRRAALDHCLKQLPPAQRQLLDRRYASNQTMDSIAAAIGRPAGSIRQTLYRLRTSLLACIAGQLAIEEPSA